MPTTEPVSQVKKGFLNSETPISLYPDEPEIREVVTEEDRVKDDCRKMLKALVNEVTAIQVRAVCPVM